MPRQFPPIHTLRSCPMLLLPAILLTLAAAACAQRTTIAQYTENFKAFSAREQQIPDPVPSLDEYANPEYFDRLIESRKLVDKYVDRINRQQNKQGSMGWASSSFMQALNEMFIATNDVKYLRHNLRLVRATLANRDDRLGRKTFWGESAPGWGCDRYAQRWNIHPVHTGMIACGVTGFIEQVQRRPVPGIGHLNEALGLQDSEIKSMIADITQTIDWHDRQWIPGPAPDEGHYISKDNEVGNEGNVLVANRLSTMGLALWGSWRASANTKHRDQAIKLARYMKRRMAIYSDGAYYWRGALPIEPITTRPDLSPATRDATEGLSHAGVTVAFPVTMARAGQVFTTDDLRAFGNTVVNGFARLDNGIVLSNIGGTTAYADGSTKEPQHLGYWLRTTPSNTQAYHRIAEFLRKYRKDPSPMDLASLIRQRPGRKNCKITH